MAPAFGRNLLLRSRKMMPLPAAMVALFAAAFYPPLARAEEPLHMTCAWKQSTDMKTYRTTPASGTTDFFYDPVSDIAGTMRKEGFDPPFVASTGNNLIEGVAHYEADGAAAEQRVEINRRTGDIKNLIKTATAAQVLEGKCIRVSGPEFGQDGSNQ